MKQDLQMIRGLKFGDDIDLQIYHFSATNNNFISAANNSQLLSPLEKWS